MNTIKLIIVTLYCAGLFISCQSSDKSKDVAALLTFSDLTEMKKENNQLRVFGDIQFISLEGEDAKASRLRGGKGKAVQFNGGWFDLGQGVNEELNISGKNISIYVRAQANSVNSFSPLLTKAGNDQNIAYSIALNKVDNHVYIESKIGSDEIGGAHLLRYKLPEDEINKWHDIIFRFDGKISQLYVDGMLRDDEVTVGEIRDWNRRPVLIGAQYKQAHGYAEVSDDQVEAKFDGMISHVALWNDYLSDKEICKLSGVAELKDAKPEYYTEKYRPQFHFTAQKNWLNDPNGLVYYNGTYHLFFQYMPTNRLPAYKDWGHAVSTDLVHWEQTQYHITPHKVWGGCWSGSAVVDPDNTAGFQVGEEKTIVAFITNGGHPGAGIGPACTQCIAYSTDGGKTFTYYDQNPIIRHISAENRDPKVIWDDASQQWIMSLFMDVNYDFGLFSSADLKKWKHLSTVSIEGVRECPGFEPLPVDGDKSNMKWMFFGANGDYVVGSFDGTNFTAETKVLRSDYGVNFYAAQTWSNTLDNKCRLIAWMPTQRYPEMPFEQLMNFPTELTLRTTANGIRVFRMPIDDIKKLYDKEYKWNNQKLNKGDNLLKELSEELYDINLEIDVDNNSSLEIVLRGVTISYNALNKTLSCGGDPVRNGIIPDDWVSKNKSEINKINNLGKAPLAPIDGKIKLRILLDRTTVEIFGNDGDVVISSCFMPKDDNRAYSLTSDKDLNISKAEIYSLKSAW